MLALKRLPPRLRKVALCRCLDHPQTLDNRLDLNLFLQLFESPTEKPILGRFLTATTADTLWNQLLDVDL